MPDKRIQTAIEKLPSEQVEEFRGCFDGFADDTGNISCESLKEIFKNLGQDMTDKEVSSSIFIRI